MTVSTPKIGSPRSYGVYETVPKTVSKFVELAIKQIEAGQGDKTLVFRNERQELMHLGSIFATAVKNMALPTEIENAEHRYGKKLTDLAKNHQIFPIDILKFGLSFCDKTTSTMTLIEEGAQTKMLNLARFCHMQFLATSDERQKIHDLVSNLEIETYKNSFQASKKVYKDIQRLSLDAKTMTYDQFQEILSKQIALGYLTEGMMIPLPHIIDSQTGQASLESGYFEVKKVIKAKGLMAFALVPKHASSHIKPTILFRPTTQSLTHENALETFCDDMCDHIGERSFNAAKAQLSTILKDPSFCASGARAHLCGFSLGGAHAARTLTEWPDAFEKATFFNDPSTEENLALKFIKNLAISNHTEQKPLIINIYHTDKDVVTHAGEMHVGYMSEDSPFYQAAKEKCQLNVKRITTVETESDTSPVPTPRVLDLAIRTKRIALKQKEHHHVGIVLSDESALRRASRSYGSFSSLSSDESPKTPRSPSLRAIEVLDQEYLNRAKDPEAKRFNTYRRDQVALRTLIFALCQIASFVSWIGNQIDTLIGRAINYVSSAQNDYYHEFLTKWFEDYEYIKTSLEDFLSVPESFQEGYKKVS